MNISTHNTADRCLIVAELSANHGQDKDVALETIRAAKRAGADAIKLQTYTPDSMTIQCENEYFTDLLKGTIWEGKTFYDLYKEAHTPWEWHEDLFNLAKDQGLICFSTPFDKSAVDFLEQFNPAAYKIASFEIQDTALIEHAASKGRPMILSTGIAGLADIELALRACRAVGNQKIVLLKCTSAYPALIEDSNLQTLPNMAETFGVEVGLSDHTMGIAASVVAVAMGGAVIEKHFILDKSVGGPDASFSLDEREFAEMVQAVRAAEKARGHVSYELSETALANKRFARSLFITEDLKAGDMLTEKNVRSIRPGYGMPPFHLDAVLGRKAKRDFVRGTPLTWDSIASD